MLSRARQRADAHKAFHAVFIEEHRETDDIYLVSQSIRPRPGLDCGPDDGGRELAGKALSLPVTGPSAGIGKAKDGRNYLMKEKDDQRFARNRGIAPRFGPGNPCSNSSPTDPSNCLFRNRGGIVPPHAYILSRPIEPDRVRSPPFILTAGFHVADTRAVLSEAAEKRKPYQNISLLLLCMLQTFLKSLQQRRCVCRPRFCN